MSATTRSLLDSSVKCRVSSVLNKNSKQFGKQFMFDGLDETCWNSHQGTPQYIVLDFNSPWTLTKYTLCSRGALQANKKFAVKARGVSQLTIHFDSSTDFYGRITIYRLDVLGNISATP